MEENDFWNDSIWLILIVLMIFSGWSEDTLNDQLKRYAELAEN